MAPHIARAQSVTICIDFNATDDITESGGEQVHVTPSGLSAADQSAIVTEVQTLYEEMLGKGNVTVKNAADGPCDGKFVIIDSGAGPGGEYGDASIQNGVAVVHIGAYIKQGFSGATLTTAIGESAAHESAHLFGMGHSKDTNSIMVEGNAISVPRRMADHRSFTSKDSARFIKLVALGNTVPQTGTFVISAPTNSTSIVPDDKATEITASTINPEAQLGYVAKSGQFVEGEYVFDPTTNEFHYAYTTIGKQSINYALHLNGLTFDGANYGNYYVADPIASSPGSYAQGMLSFNVPGVGSVPMFINLPSSGVGGGFSPLLNIYSWKNPFGGNVLKRSDLDEFYVVVTPNYIEVEGRYDEDTWDAPLGTEIVDAGLEEEFFDPWIGEDVAYYWVLLNNGECYLLKFVTSYDTKTTTFSTADYLPPNPFMAGGGAISIFDGPITVFGSGTVTRYDSTQSKWVEDTAGLNSAYVYAAAADTNGRIYAATSKGLSEQQNTSLSWTSTGFPQGYTASVYVDRSGRVFASNNDGVYKSTDHGTTWTLDTAGTPYQFHFTQFGDDAFGNIYAVANSYSSPSRLYRSMNGTSPWVEIAQSVMAQIFDKSQVYNVNSISGDTSLSLATKFGLYRSTDHGSTWTEDNEYVHSSSYYSVVKNAQGKLLIGNDNGIFSGYYGDTSWRKLWPPSGTLNQNRKTLSLDALGELHTIGSALSGYGNFGSAIAHSTDGGQTWTQDSSSVGVVSQTGVFFADPSGKEYIGTYGSTGVPTHIYSHPKQGPWAVDEHGFVSPGTQFSSPLAFGSDGSSAYFAVTDSNWALLWKNTSGTWTLDTAGLHKDQIYSFGWNGHTLYAGGAYGIYQKSGNAWISLPFPKDIPAGANPFYISEDSSGALFSSFFTQLPSGNYGTNGVYFTKDQGQHWMRVNLANGIPINGLYSYQDSTYVLTTKGVFAFTSRLWARSYIPEGTHTGGATTLHFGNVATGAQASIPIRITNFGNDSLRITGYTSTNSAFSLTKLPAVVGPGNVLNAQVQFLPSTNGTAQSTLVFASNSIAGPDTIVADGAANVNGVSDLVPPAIVSLESYPNPFVSSTTIQYVVAARVGVTLTIFNVLGQQIATLANDVEDAGSHSVSFEAAGLAEGTYIARLQAGPSVLSRHISIVH